MVSIIFTAKKTSDFVKQEMLPDKDYFVKHISGQMLSSKQYQNLKSIITGLQ
jgi:hypothetical protein